ncbi:hypothetical protein CDD83_10247 [Cordyceps sp. RAO-2017]|nr:hypothetical protein CDD83_10247 [Cordyceps sp. RAO-2017]
MEFYAVILTALCLLNAALIRHKHRSQPAQQATHPMLPVDSAKQRAAQRFQRSFLAVYGFAVAADWLQGPHIYALYKYEKQLPEEMVAMLYTAGFISGAISATVAGQLVDRRGRRSGCYDYALYCCFSCGLMISNRLPLLFLSRILGGVATTLLFSAFESWMVAEYHFLELDDSVLPLRTIFDNMALVSSTVAILSGIAGDALVHASGQRFMPFLAAQACCLTIL